MKTSSIRLAACAFALFCLLLSILMWLRDPGATVNTGATDSDQSQASFQLRAIDQLPARQIDYWKPMLAKPLGERVILPPSEVLEYLKADNLFQGYSDIPHEPKEPTEQMKLAKEALSNFPEPLQRQLTKQLAGIVLVRELGSSAITNWIVGSNAGFIAIDVEALNKKANEWASWRDSTPFEPGRYKVRTTIAEAADDSILRAYEYILLHEIAHVLSIGETFHPNWDDPTPVADLEKYSFAKMSWLPADGGLKRSSDQEGVPLPKIPYYAKVNQLPNGAIPKTYETLLRSPFPTLYAATSVYDDFAESFATFVHTQIMQRPYFIEIFDGDQLTKRIDLCYGQPDRRCAEKEKSIRYFYSRL